MRAPGLITLGMATIAVAVGAGGGAMLLHQGANRALATDAANAAVITGATLAAETKLQDERAAIGNSLARHPAINDTRSATDAAFDAISQALRFRNSAWTRDIPVRLEEARQHLTDLRHRADALLARPPADRSETDLGQIASDMTAIVTDLAPVLDIAEATLARTDPAAGSLATTARLATEMRDYAGRLNLALTPFSRHHATDAGRLEALIEQLRRFFGRTGHDQQAEQALNEVERDVRAGLGQARQGGGLTDAPAGPGAGFSPVLRSAGQFADAALAELNQRVRTAVADRERSFGRVSLILALILAAIGVICWIMRARFSAAARDLGVTIATRAQADETGFSPSAFQTVRARLQGKARTIGPVMRRPPAGRKVCDIKPETVPPDDAVLTLPTEMIIEDDILFDPARASGNGKERFNGYILGAAFVNGCIRDSIAADDRDALQAAARRLSDTSRSAGAIRIGMLAQTLQQAAPQANPKRLAELETDILAAFALTSAAIKRFTATLPD